MTFPVLLQPLAVLLAATTLTACTLGPDYRRPEVPMVAEFAHAEGWKPASPGDTLIRGTWWTLYGDPELDTLVARLNLDNQSLAAAEAQYRQARALVRGSRAQLFPFVSGNAGYSRSGQSQGAGTTAEGGAVSERFELGVNASWEADLWGRLRRGLEADRASAGASAADLAAVRLSLQAELVQTYLQLRVLDVHQELLEQTLEAYRRTLRLTQNQYDAGIARRSDVTQARAQLKTTEAQAIDLRWQRAQHEHAIAVLVGVPPAGFAIERREELPGMPLIPAGLPSELLERRPDVAAAERRVMVANAGIGVAQAAWFPDLVLSAGGGYADSSLANLISVPNRFWSLGPQLGLSLLDFGTRRAEVELAEARYDEVVAHYRQTVLDSLREVENYLVQIRVLQEEAAVQEEALQAAQESLRLMENQYRAGIVDFLSVATLQTNALDSERTNLMLLGNRLTASVLLIAALGGGWDALD
ncbi:efflux transporter outer membrane subunit [Stutzerimonas tarimensis]|uniref:Efflux transporter outer membrane subunit n=1 Tax=Stutzerimonas tarimensis TaxID=1507735 RepID=A0ABV7T2P7_9GAMM